MSTQNPKPLPRSKPESLNVKALSSGSLRPTPRNVSEHLTSSKTNDSSQRAVRLWDLRFSVYALGFRVGSMPQGYFKNGALLGFEVRAIRLLCGCMSSSGSLSLRYGQSIFLFEEMPE